MQPLTTSTEKSRLPSPRGAAVQDDGLARLERRLRASVAGLGALTEAGEHHFGSGGKRLRGRLALEAAYSTGASTSEALPIAVAVELLHNASLVHDDLQDADRQRRGALAVWAQFDKPTALLLGDALLARAFVALAEVPSPHLGSMTRTLGECVAGLARGQCSDGTKSPRIAWSVESYEELARAKTGELFALPVELACLSAYGPGSLASAAARAFELVGVAFQMYDDLADVAGTKGRAVGSDLRCKRFSAVVLHHRLATGPRPRSLELDDVFAGIPIEKQAEIVLAGPGVTATRVHQDEVLARAIDCGSALPRSLRTVLQRLADDVRAATSALVEDAATAADAERAGLGR
ncbi:MAG: polyprenyl synthetase family protein [Planctomycetota bacterium]